MDNAARSNFIRGFDVTGEFETLVEALKGYIINLDGSQGIINPLQVFKTVDNSYKKDYDPNTDLKKDDHLSFMEHLSKTKVFYRYISQSNNQEEVDEFERLMRNFYHELGLGHGDFLVTELEINQYPIFDDFLDYVRNELYEDEEKKIIRSELSIERSKRIEKNRIGH